MLNRALSAVLLAGCAGGLAVAAVSSSPPPSAATSGHAQIGTFGLDLAGGDPGVKPGDDFARHANGHWLDTAQIPPDRASWGSFAMLRERSLQQVRDILDSLPKDNPAGSNEQRLYDFYRSYLDTEAIERAGLSAHLWGGRVHASVGDALAARRALPHGGHHDHHDHQQLGGHHEPRTA